MRRWDEAGGGGAIRGGGQASEAQEGLAEVGVAGGVVEVEDGARFAGHDARQMQPGCHGGAGRVRKGE
ncbi:MAG: hypothetical protein AAF078_10145, partial [Planctomycetota bacterium]